MSQDTFSLDNFEGTTRLFPLPNLVVFPHVVQPLHIFESRYVEMLEDAIASDHLIAMGLLLPGWEGQYEGRPSVDSFVCLGRVLSHSPTKDDGYNILLGGISRAKIVEELPAKRSYREVRVEVLHDVAPPANDSQTITLHQELITAFRKFIPDNVSAQKQLGEILETHAHLGTLTDLISYSLSLDLEIRQTLLAELDVVQRTQMLLHQLQREDLNSDQSPTFPPEFSDN